MPVEAGSICEYSHRVVADLQFTFKIFYNYYLSAFVCHHEVHRGRRAAEGRLRDRNNTDSAHTLFYFIGCGELCQDIGRHKCGSHGYLCFGRVIGLILRNSREIKIVYGKPLFIQSVRKAVLPYHVQRHSPVTGLPSEPLFAVRRL